MNPEDLLRMIDVLHREKDIPVEVLFRGLEEAIATAMHMMKQFTNAPPFSSAS